MNSHKTFIENLIVATCCFVCFSCYQIADNTPLPKVISGEIIRLQDFASTYVAPRNIDIWLPENFDSTKSYAVVYMHDGQMLFDADHTWNKQEWRADETANKLISAKITPPFIIVGIWNAGADRYMDYFPQKPFESLSEGIKDSLLFLEKKNNKTRNNHFSSRADDYLSFIVKELKPYLEKHYSISSDKASTFIAGSSMGGLISWYALCEYPEIFGGAACLSTHWPGIFRPDNNPVPIAFAQYLSENLPDPETHKLYFDIGTETLDSLYLPFQKMVDTVMMNKGYTAKTWQSRIFVGENHSETSWNKRLYIPFQFLLGNSFPGELVMFTKDDESSDFQTCGYINLSGDTIIQAGKYKFCFSDTLRDFAIVIDNLNKLKAINILGNELYEVYNFDNGPDPIMEDRFRILKDSLIGYANSLGDISILPQFKCASPFENGKARVSFDCVRVKDGEHTFDQSLKWFYIDKHGIILN